MKKIGIIGCSSIAKREIIPAFQNVRGVKIEIIGSRSKQKAKNIAKENNVKKSGSYEQVLENPEIDAVYISLPISLHEKWSIKAAKAGKNILCEKSAVTSLDSAKRVIRECEKNDVKILEAFAYKFHPQHKKIKDLINRNTIGKTKYLESKNGFPLKLPKNNFRFNKKLGGGALNDIGCYIINSGTYYFNKPKSITCKLKRNFNNSIEVGGIISMEFENSNSSVGLFSYESYFQSTYSIWGSKGVLTSERAYNIKKNMKSKILIQKKDKVKNLLLSPHNQYQLMVQNFLKIISKKSNYFNEFLLQAKIMEAARQSDKKNKTIFLD